MDMLAKIDAHVQGHRTAVWEGTFRDYLPLVMGQPSLARRAHARLYDMIKAAGVRVDDAGKEHYAFFEQDLFGIDEPLAQVVEYLKAAAMGSDVGRRIPAALRTTVIRQKPACHPVEACPGSLHPDA